MTKPDSKNYLVFSLALVSLLLPTTFLVAENSSALLTPTIAVTPDAYYPLDEILYLEGLAAPNAAVEIYFQKQGAKPLTFQTKTDPRGEWVLAERVPLGAGEWEIRARSVLNGQVSEWSNPRLVNVIVNGITIGGINIKFAAMALLLFMLAIVGGTIFVVLYGRVRRLKRALLAKEIQEAQDSMREGLSEIRRDLLGELRSLDATSRPLAPEETSRREHILRELDTLERNMAREIGDITRI